MLRGSLIWRVGSTQSSECSVVCGLGLGLEPDEQCLHSFPRFWSGGVGYGTTAGRLLETLGYGNVWPLHVPSPAWPALRR
eukprot:3034041-Pleurochrysis_carterae.AAC.1